MKTLRQRALNGELLTGAWLNLASSLTAEMAGRAGFDWILIDQEHGVGESESLLHQLQALEASSACPIVRIAWNDGPRFKRALDLGPGGIMVPYVNSVEEARQAVAAMRFPPQGTRGVARSPRAAGFGLAFEPYFAAANEELLTVVQIETGEAVADAAEIAGVEGVDVLFVGPLDLSVNLGIPQQYDRPEFRAATATVIAAARNAGKAAGTLLATPAQIGPAIADGYTFIAASSDGAMVANGMKALSAAFGEARHTTS